MSIIDDFSHIVDAAISAISAKREAMVTIGLTKAIREVTRYFGREPKVEGATLRWRVGEYSYEMTGTIVERPLPVPTLDPLNEGVLKIPDSNDTMFWEVVVRSEAHGVLFTVGTPHPEFSVLAVKSHLSRTRSLVP